MRPASTIHLFVTALCALVLFAQSDVQAGPITSGNLLALRVGDGTTTPAGTALPFFIDEFAVTYSGGAPSGVSLVQSIPIQTTTATSGNRALTQGGTAAAEGGLQLSVNGQYVTFAGYNAAIGNGASG